MPDTPQYRNDIQSQSCRHHSVSPASLRGLAKEVAQLHNCGLHRWIHCDDLNVEPDVSTLRTKISSSAAPSQRLYSIINLLHRTQLFQRIHRCTASHRTTPHALDSTDTSASTCGRIPLAFVRYLRHVCMHYSSLSDSGARHYGPHHCSLGSSRAGDCARRCEHCKSSSE